MNFYELSLLLEDEETTTKAVTLDDDISDVLSDYQLAYKVVPGYGITKIKDIIKHTYDQFKKAAWDKMAEDFGYVESGYIPHPPEGFNELSDAGKKAVIYERALGYLRSFVVQLGWITAPNYSRGNYSWKREKFQFPPEFSKWAKYMIDEMDHDDEIKGWNQRSDKERADHEEKRQEDNRQQQELANTFGKELYKQRKKIEKINPEWAGLTEQEAYKIAEDYMKANSYERGQWMPIVQQIAQKVMGRKSGSAKSYYMDDKEVQKLSTTKNIQQMTDVELVDTVNKTIGALNHPDVGGMEWGEVHPGLSAGVLGNVAGLRMQAVNELKNRLIANKNDRQRVWQMYYALDAENRRHFFK